ncbi:ribosomal RNA processing protein [Coprinopsis cinerea okayama7|uniref:Ribosomal RNA processing protein n=1 Tax=Coprinopsis cinerea (strain Okayama-7 / 130 / ATCC MYA-4618 / FGSC 9003) TaxID=240176 RepID=A8N2U4_COPC7|nr:rRNA processing protein RRP1 [Coprinopsis cinerea okayama7\|eukprot:XP_001829166.1 rRNA processing protein RRP1 [Coprinopsis cinerea okayama7\
MATASTSLPLGKVLASTDKKTRDKAIKNLSAFLSQSGENAISKPDMDKLWKGIFYCFWMSDKPLVQQGLASELAELLLTIPSNNESIAFLRGFWETIVREWNGIDRLRIDKYYMLVRRFVNASFRLLQRAKWDKSIIEQYTEILNKAGGPLCPVDIKVPTSLSYHLADIYLEELEKVQRKATEADKLHPIPLLLILEPFFTLSAQTTSKLTFKRVESSLWRPLFVSLSSQSDEQDEEDDGRPRKRARLDDDDLSAVIANSCLRDPSSEKPLSREDLRKQLRRALFDVASRPETRDSSRRQLYVLYKDEEGESDDDD